MAKNEMVLLDWKLLGAALAILDDTDQGAFFEGFARELVGPSYESHMKREMQMLAAGEKIPGPCRKWLKEYLPCLWYEAASD